MGRLWSAPGASWGVLQPRPDARAPPVEWRTGLALCWVRVTIDQIKPYWLTMARLWPVWVTVTVRFLG